MMNLLHAVQTTSSTLWLQIILVLVLTVIIGLVARKALNNLQELRSSPDWLKSLCSSFSRPSTWLIWGYGVLLSIEIVAAQSDIPISASIVANSRNIFFILVATWVLLDWRVRYESVLKEKIVAKNEESDHMALIYALGKVFSVLLVFIAGFIILDILGFPLTTLLAFGGLGGVAVGLAAKDIVANLFGGLMIHMNRHFSVGDWIMSPNKHFEGTVEEIGWYLTKILTFERRPTFIPNALITDAIIENPGRMYNRRIKETIGVRYEDVNKVKVIVEDIEKMLKEHPAIDQKQIILVDFVRFGPSSLDIEVYCFTKTTSWKQWRIEQQEIFLRIVDIITSHKGEIAFPTQTLHIEKGK